MSMLLLTGILSSLQRKCMGQTESNRKTSRKRCCSSRSK